MAKGPKKAPPAGHRPGKKAEPAKKKSTQPSPKPPDLQAEPQLPRFDSGLLASVPAATGVQARLTSKIANNEGAVLRRAAGVSLDRGAEEARALSLLETAAAAATAADARTPVVVIADSGSGKSTFLAQLVAKLRNTQLAAGKLFDTVVAVFVGATEGSTSISRVLQAVLAALPQAEDAEASSSWAPEDFHSLQSVLLARLTALGEDQGKRTCLVFDAVNELDSTHGARALRWLPVRLPTGCAVMLSTIGAPPAGSEGDNAGAIEDVRTALQQRWGLHDSESGTSAGVMRLGMIDRAGRATLLRQLTKSLGGPATLTDEECDAALAHAGAVSPLWLKLLAQEMSNPKWPPRGLASSQAACPANLGVSPSKIRPGSAKVTTATTALVDIIYGFPATSSSVFERHLERLDSAVASIGDGVVAAAQLTLSAVYCTAGGMFEEQLLQLLADRCAAAAASAAAVHTEQQRAPVTAGAKPKDAVRYWDAMLHAGLSAVVRVSSPDEWATTSSGAATKASATSPKLPPSPMDSTALTAMARLPVDAARATVGFVHMQARDAVRRRYLKTMEEEASTHRALATYFSSVLPADSGQIGAAATPELTLGDTAWVQCLRRVPLHWTLAGELEKSRLLELSFLEAKSRAHLSHELLEDYSRALESLRQREAPTPGGLRGQLEDFRDTVAKAAHVLDAHPYLVRQLALNERDSSAAAVVAGAGPTTAQAADDSSKRESSSTLPTRPLLRWQNKPQQRSACTMTFTGFGMLVWAIAISPDGTKVAIGGSDCCVHVLDFESSSELSCLIYHKDDITFVCWIDNAWLVSSADRDCLALWNTTEPEKPAQTVAIKGGVCTGLACGPDRSVVACCHRQQLTLFTVSAEDGLALGFEFAESSVLSVATSGGGDGGARGFSGNSGGGDSGSGSGSDDDDDDLSVGFAGASFSPDGRLAVGSGNSVCVWSQAAGTGGASTTAPTCQLRLAGHEEEVTAVSWSPADADGRLQLLASSSVDATARVWAVAATSTTGGGEQQEVTCVAVLTGHTDCIRDLCWWQGGALPGSTTADAGASSPLPAQMLLTASGDKSIRAWTLGAETATGKSDANLTDFEQAIVFRGHSNDVRRVCVHPSNAADKVVSASDDGTVKVWSVANGRKADAPPGHSDAITACAWCRCRDGSNVVISADKLGGVACFSAACTASERHWHTVLPTVSPSCKAVAAVSECGTGLVACAGFKQIYVLSCSDGAIQSRLPCPDWANHCATTELRGSAPDDRVLVAAGDGGFVKLWCCTTETGSQAAAAAPTFAEGAVVPALEGADVMCCSMRADVTATGGKESVLLLAAGSNTGRILLFSAPSGAGTAALQHSVSIPEDCDTGWVLSLALSPSGGTLAAAIGGTKGALLVYSVAAGSNATQAPRQLQLRASQIGCGAMAWAYWLLEEVLITSAAAKALICWRVNARPSAAVETALSVDGGLELWGMFPSSGTFGSPDGIGGQGAVLSTPDAAPSLCLAIGDQGGRLYKLAISLPRT